MTPTPTIPPAERASERAAEGFRLRLLAGPEPRPHPNLLKYYALQSLLAGPFFWIPLIPLYFRYHTLRYRFDEEGVTMRWGVLFRREISLNYARIQDIHLSSNLFERWLGLARIQVQTASGSATAEMTIEGLQEFEAIRDFLYSRMRGARSDGPSAAEGALAGAAARARSLPPGGQDVQELTATLQAVAEELRALRAAVEARPAADGEVPRA